MHLNKIVTFTLFALLLCSPAWGGQPLSQRYQFSAELSGDNYVLHWSTNQASKKIEFAVNVSTTGWVGFGLSPNGQMPGSDVVIGWVDNTGKVTFHDRFADTRSLPTIDSSQDWLITRGSEENGRTVLEFYRNFTSCDDDNDMDIKADTARVIWSYHSQDPSTLGQLAELEHESKGSLSLNLLGGLSEDRVESNSESIKILNENVLIPSDTDTTYWCTVHEIPDEIEQQERYMYKVSPVIYGPTAQYVHHIVAYLCTNLNDTHVGASQKCSGTRNIDIDLCRFSGILFAAWAVGGVDFVFPDGVGYPFGGKGSQYILLELHYDNPSLDTGMTDNSGLEFFYVNEEPQHRAGVLTFGHQAGSAMMIPPKANNYIVNAICPEQCTEEFLPSSGINLFANLLHTHLAGHGLVVRHLRKTSKCGGLEELPPIDENMRYDFNYQQSTYLPETVNVLPGDILHLECSYRTSDPAYQTMVLGGESTREEMCFTFLYYYPEIDMNYCVGAQLVSENFTTKYFDKNTTTALFNSVQRNDHKEVKSIFQDISWNSETVEQFQASVHSSYYQAGCVNAANFSASIVTSQKLPDVKCPYMPPLKDCPNTVSVAGNAQHENFHISLFFISLLSLWHSL